MRTLEERIDLPWTSKHLQWLNKSNQTATTADGKDVEIWEFQHQANEDVLREWAKHFRNHYCSDSQIDILRDGTSMTRAQYLNNLKFPDKTIAPGPSIRSGDFAEILAADYLEFKLNFWVPRGRYINKAIRNESTKGSDTVGFFFAGNFAANSPNDTLAIFESKAQYTSQSRNSRLQDAIDDSGKDVARKADSLNAIKHRFIEKQMTDEARRVQRFQDEVDRPFKQLFGAIAHIDSSIYNEEMITSSNASNHPYENSLKLIVITGRDMMRLVHDLYKRAADEA